MLRYQRFPGKMARPIDLYCGLAHYFTHLIELLDNKRRLFTRSSIFLVTFILTALTYLARSRGSPAYQFGLMNTMYITHLNGVATPGNSSHLQKLTLDLDAFLKVALT